MRYSKRELVPEMTIRANKRIWWAIALLALAWTPTIATAQWTDIPYAKPFFLQIDPSSVLKTSDTEFRLSWRFGRDPERRFSEYIGRIDCFDVKVVLEQESRVDKTGWPDPKYHTSKYNYREGTTEYIGRKSVMDDQERSRAVHYPGAESSEFQVIRYMCESEPGFKEAHELRGASVQARNKCDRADNATKAMCKPDQETRELLGLLITRTVQMEEVCGADSDQMDALLAYWIAESLKCRTRGGEPCGMYSLQSATSTLGEDLSSAQLGQPCRQLPIALRSMEKRERDELALDSFRNCVTNSIQALDDRISPANVVAEGVIASCRSHLPSDLVSGTEFTSGIVPTITAGVLRSRQKQPPATHKRKARQGDVGNAASTRK